MEADDDRSFEESFADIGARETYLETTHEDAVKRVREAFTNAGFGNPTEFSPSENIREHTGEELPPPRVIGIGNPHAGKIVAEATQGDPDTLLPCHVAVPVPYTHHRAPATRPQPVCRLLL